MEPPDTRPRRRTAPRALTIGVLGLLATLAGGLTLRATCERSDRQIECPDVSVPRGDRCCAEGQANQGGQCVGNAKQCPPHFELTRDGCVVRPSRVRVEPNRMQLGPGDWEAQGVVAPREVVLDHPILLDAYEVTVHRWMSCVDDRVCESLHGQEAGCPVRGVSHDQARAFCRWSGGDLPSDDAWLIAASGREARRYPWGSTGAVCRRADWGRVAGPCAIDAKSPQWAGLFRDDETPEGIVGMAGGVTEWVLGTSGEQAVRGGSWKSSLATELRTWRSATHPSGYVADDIGFRCAYEPG